MSALALPIEVLAWVAGAVLLLAGGAKLRSPGGTVTALRDASLPASDGLVRLLGVGELATGAAVLAVGGAVPSAVAAALYGAFVVFVARQRRTVGASCGCFGEERTPVSGIHLGTNVVLTLALAGAVVTDAGPALGGAGSEPVTAVGTLVLVAAAAWLVRLGLTAGAELQAAVALHPEASA